MCYYRVTGPLIEDEGYWERCCKERWSLCMVTDHGGKWKRMYFEKHIQEIIEQFTPNTSNIQEVSYCSLCVYTACIDTCS